MLDRNVVGEGTGIGAVNQEYWHWNPHEYMYEYQIVAITAKGTMWWLCTVQYSLSTCGWQGENGNTAAGAVRVAIHDSIRDPRECIYTYKRVVCVCLFVCLLFIGHTTFVHFAALPPSGREQDQPSSRAAPRARASACTARARARMAYNFSTEKSLRWCLSKTKPYARAHAVVYVTAEIFKKKGKQKTNMPFPKFSLQFAFSWSVYFSNRSHSHISF